ncbi:MAG: hypothetical protein ACPL3B_05100, partial [Fervidobacterium sp.]
VLTAAPSGYIAEYPVYGKGWIVRDKILEKCVKIFDGKAKLVNKSGIGLDEKELSAFEIN